MTGPAETLTKRWTALKSHAVQQRYWGSSARFNVVPAGRRSGKTELAKRKLVRSAMLGTQYDDPRFFAAAPTRDQAKRIYWDDLKKMTPDWLLAETPRESDLMITLVNGARIMVVGMDKPQRIEGQPWDGGILDEYADMRATAWLENVRPALSDRRGWCDLIGVPEGRNHYYDRYRYAMDSGDPEWSAYHWISADILPADEIAAAKRDLDEQTYLQEYEASFLYYQGRAYYTFSEQRHCRRLDYDPQRPLIFCFDFNVDPGVAAVLQETGDETRCIGEVWIPTNSNTPAVCRKLAADWSHHNGYVLIYGDATGGNRGSAKTQGSDWDLVKMELRQAFGDRLQFNVPPSNPSERSRLNAVNTRMLSGDGVAHFVVDPSKAPHVVKDFEGTQLLQGGSGELDKKRNRELTHISDAIGYYIVKEFPTREKSASTTHNRIA